MEPSHKLSQSSVAAKLPKGSHRVSPAGFYSVGVSYARRSRRPRLGQWDDGTRSMTILSRMDWPTGGVRHSAATTSPSAKPKSMCDPPGPPAQAIGRTLLDADK
jgi:hypothetical protein